MIRIDLDSKVSRRALSAAAISLTAVGAVGCSDKSTSAEPTGSSTAAAPTSAATTPEPSGASTPEVKATMVKNLDAINVSGKVGDMPTVRASWPINIEKTQSKVLIAGKGIEVPDAKATVEVNYAGVNCRNGQRFDDSYSRGKSAAFPLDGVVAGFSKGLVGKKVGDRVLIMMPSTDGYVEGNPQAGINPGDALIFVVDILAVSLKGPSGEAVAPKAGLPTVKDNGSGKAPTITIGADLTKPTELVVQPLIKGTGKAVSATDTVQVHYTMVSWAGKELAQSYSTGPETGALASLIEGWKQGLVKQPVGSRVLLVVPPALGYPKGLPERNVEAGETLVFVVDILFTQSA